MAGRDRVEMGQSQPSLTLPGAAALASYFCFSQREQPHWTSEDPHIGFVIMSSCYAFSSM